MGPNRGVRSETKLREKNPEGVEAPWIGAGAFQIKGCSEPYYTPGNTPKQSPAKTSPEKETWSRTAPSETLRRPYHPNVPTLRELTLYCKTND